MWYIMFLITASFIHCCFDFVSQGLYWLIFILLARYIYFRSSYIFLVLIWLSVFFQLSSHKIGDHGVIYYRYQNALPIFFCVMILESLVLVFNSESGNLNKKENAYNILAVIVLKMIL